MNDKQKHIFLHYKDDLFFNITSTLSEPIEVTQATTVALVNKYKKVKYTQTLYTYENSTQEEHINSSTEPGLPSQHPTLAILQTEFRFRLNNLPEYHLQNIDKIQSLEHLNHIAYYLRLGQITRIGDTSVKHNKGTHAYIIEKLDKKVHLKGAAPVEPDK